MKKINKPLILQQDICNSIKGLNYVDRIITKSAEYDFNLYNVESLLKDENQFISKNADFKVYMKKIYSNKFSNAGKTYEESYKYYRQIRDSERVCPYCNFLTRTVSQLDHYLPKSVFPSFSITAVNLVPICSDCNKLKDNYYSLEKDNMFLHPYFDEVMGTVHEFLKCRIVEKDNIGFEFYITKLGSWDDETYHRVKFHFEKLRLNELYLADFIADFTVFINEIELVKDLDRSLIIFLIDNKMKALLKSMIKPWTYAGFKSIFESKWFFDVYLEIKMKNV